MVRIGSIFWWLCGIAGVFEGLFAPLGLRRIYAQVLTNLAGSF